MQLQKGVCSCVYLFTASQTEALQQKIKRKQTPLLPDCLQEVYQHYAESFEQKGADRAPLAITL